MSSFVLCVGCEEPLYDFSPCRWCTCEQCGIDLRDGFCPLCNSRNSCVYDPNPYFFDCPPDSYHSTHPTYETYSYDSYGNDSQFGYDCQPQFPLNYESEQGYNENYTSYPYDSSSLPQQYPCCTRCGGPHMNFQCQPMNQDSYSLGFEQPQPPQSFVIHQPPQELSIQEMEDLKQQYLDELKRLSNLEYRDEIKIAELTENFNGMSIEIRKKEKLLQLEQWAYLSTHPSKRLTSFCYDDDDDYNSAITPVLSTEEPVDSLSMGDEHLDTIPATESDEVIKSSVEDLVPIPSESEGIPEHTCDVPFHDNSLPLDVLKDQFKDFSESNNEVSSMDDESFSIDKINYVEASPLDSELVSSEVMEIVIPKVRGIDDDIPLTIKDDNLRDKLLNVNLLIATIEALNDNPTLSFDCKTKSSSTSLDSLLEETSTFHNSLLEFENFYFDLGEISSGSTTTHSDISLSEYDSFIFAHEEFVDELAHIISPPEYDCFYFMDLPDPGELMSVLNSEIRENLLSTTLVNLPIKDDYSPLLAYVVWIFLAYLTYPVIPPYLYPFGNEDTIFDPGITINSV
uniref:Pre-mRNA splicing Prp18-interacting factor n=1 Tax=Tanacetum cinerariifolium TaxID=118510 RepID=A0A699LD67_TANCI|nr:hypothetical protein [Tanacetum cinerariifolium]